MSTTWSFIGAGAVALACAAGIVGGEAAKGELRIAEAATSISAGSQALDLFAALPVSLESAR